MFFYLVGSNTIYSDFLSLLYVKSSKVTAKRKPLKHWQERKQNTTPKLHNNDNKYQDRVRKKHFKYLKNE